MFRPRTLAALCGVALAVGAATTTLDTASAQPLASASKAALAPRSAADRALLAKIRERAVRYAKKGVSGPIGANPEVALVPKGAVQDRYGWARAQKQKARASAAQRAARVQAFAAGSGGPLVVAEQEPAGVRGKNDSLRTAQRIPAFGTRSGGRPVAAVKGRLSPSALPKIEAIPPNAEDDGTLETARDTGLRGARDGFSTTGTIGDQPVDPKDPGAEDNDIYKVKLNAGDVLDVKLSVTSGNLLPLLILADADGNIVTDSFFSDDETNPTLQTTVRAGGTYYVVATGFILIDLSGGPSGPTKGDYTITTTARVGDRDLYAVQLQAGDVLGLSVDGASSYVSIFGPDGVELHGSAFDISSAYPANTPLPGGGNVTTDHVAGAKGTYYVEVTGGSGRYTATVEGYRYGGAKGKQTQTVFLDTDGARLNTNIFGGPGVRTFSPLKSFLSGWGLKAKDEKALVNRIKAVMRTQIQSDLVKSGLSPYVNVNVVASQDVKDPWGKPGVTRVILGGTIDQLGFPTVGISEAIDPGNYDREKSALVLLDLLSAGKGTPYPATSLNTYMTAKSNRIAFVGQAVATVASHELGHLIGNWHTDTTNGVTNLMDEGGYAPAAPLFFGVGKDKVGGTKDDKITLFVRDRFSLREGFTGVEDTKARSAWGLSSPR